VVRAHRLTKEGLVQEREEKVRLVRGRFGQSEVIDILLVLFADAVSGERTVETVHARLPPFSETVMGLFGREKLPPASTVSRFLADGDATCVQARREWLLQEVMAPSPCASPGGLWDREGTHWEVVDIDGTRQAVRQRALVQGSDASEPHRRMAEVYAKGSGGRTRGEVGRTRTTVLHPSTPKWRGTVSGPGNGDDRGEVQHAQPSSAS